MKLILNLILVYCLIVSQAFGQATNPNDQMKIGDKSSSVDKGFTFETGDGVSNKKLLVEKISKKLKWNGNSVQIGDGSASSDKELVIAGALKSLKYNGTSGEFEFNDDVKLIGSLKTDIIQAINSEVDVKNILRAELGVKFGTGNAEIKYDTGLNSLVFSNDGTLYKKVGSGSGGGDGGVSILKNGSFEDGDMNWTSTGGSHAISSYANGTESDLKYATFTATSASQTFCSDLATTPSYFGAGGMVDFTYTGTGTAFLMYVVDSLGNKLTAPQALLNQTAWTKLSPIPFSFNTSQKICFESISASSISLDKVYLGSNKNVSGGNSSITEGITYKGYISKNGSGHLKFKTRASLKSTNINLIDDNSGDRTVYTVKKNGACSLSMSVDYYVANNFNQFIRHYNSSNAEVESSRQYLGAGTVVGSSQPLSTVVSAGDYFFVYTDGTPTDNASTNFGIVCSFDNSDQVQTPEASQWFIDANIGGSIPALGSGAQTSFTTISDSGLDLVLNQGSSPAFISCNGYDSNGFTCPSSSEQVGVSFVPPYSGQFEACAEFGFYTNGATEVNTTFQLVETGIADNVVMQEGKSRIYVQGNTVSSLPFKLCGTFNFSNTSKKNIKLAFEKNASTQSPTVLADRSATNGQRDIHITVRPLLQNSLRAILTGDQVTTKGASKAHTFSFNFGQNGSLANNCTASPCGYDSIGGEVIGVTRYNTGAYYALLDRIYSKVKCVASSHQVGIGLTVPYPDLGVFNCTNCSQVTLFFTNSASAASDTMGVVNCHALE